MSTPSSLQHPLAFRRVATLAAGILAIGAVTGVSLSGASGTPVTTVVTTIGDLQSATDPCSGDLIVELGQDISSDASEVVIGCNVTLDLKSFDLTIRNIIVNPGNTLTIQDTSSGHDGILTANAPASEVGTPGIQNTGAAVDIESGFVRASGGLGGAGIGAGDDGFFVGDAGSTTINGGDVAGIGGADAAGIGGGHSGGVITINGGTVEADGVGSGAGIGGGRGSVGGIITINGGTVTARSHLGGGAGIGGADGSSSAMITINGGTVNASADGFGAGIGLGEDSDSFPDLTVNINGGTVTADSHGFGAGIGGGKGGDGGDVTIGAGADVTASGESDASAIGPGDGASLFGSLVVAGTLRVPSGDLVINDNSVTTQENQVTIESTGRIVGTDADDNDGAQFSGDGSIGNSGSITLSAAKVTGGSPAVAVNSHHYKVTFDTQGGSSPSADVTVFADTFAHGSRTFPPDPTKTGFTFTGWNTAADGSGDTITGTTALPGSSTTGAAHTVALFANWSGGVDVAPTITGSSTATGTIGSPFTYTPTVGGSPAPTVALSSGTLPDGLSLNAANGVISGTPTGSPSVKNVVLKAANGVSPDATLAVEITVSAADVAPSLTGAPTATGTVGSPFTYTPTVGGSPAPTVTLSSGNLPGGLSLSSTTGAITGTPTQAGPFAFTLKASNGVGSDATLAVTITISDPVPGTFNPGPTAAITGDARVGSTLTAGEGSPNPTPDSYTYRWFANGVEIGGATSKTFTLTGAQNGKTIKVEVTAVKAGYTSKFDTSAPTGVVTSLPAKHLLLETSSSTYAGNSLSVKIEKLDNKEPYTIRIDDIVVKSGLADSHGKVNTKVTVPLSLHPGNHTITGTGAFADRFDTDDLKLKNPSDLNIEFDHSSVKKGKSQTVKIRHLLIGEEVEVRYDGTLISPLTAKGDSDGEYELTFNVGATVGTHSVKVTGLYDGRNKTKTFKVTN